MVDESLGYEDRDWRDVVAPPAGETARGGLHLRRRRVDYVERKKNEEALLHSHAELSAHAEELARFNRAAVGREMRMIELKKEVNELCLRLGEAARYPLEFERDEEGKEAYV